jgi:RsmE family RNA methyltransferase
MNLILLFPEDFVSGSSRVRIDGRRFQHAKEVLQAGRGDFLDVGLINGPMGKGVVIHITESALEMDVALDAPPPDSLPVTVILALPRPKVIKRVILSLTSLGVKRIWLIHAYRVEKSYWQSPVLSAEALRLHGILGLEQARDTIAPEISFARFFKPFAEDILPGLIQGTLPLVAHPKAEDACPAHVHGPVTLAVGPEGGFIPYEIETLLAQGMKPVSLGPRILRVETALPALLSRLF